MSQASASSKQVTSAIVLPPYGYMPANLQWEIDSRRVPDTFAIQGRPAAPAEFAAFVDQLLDELAGFLWPRYDRATHQWVGAAAQNMVALCRTDLVLMDRPPLQGKLLQAPMAHAGPVAATHKTLFLKDDASDTSGMALYMSGVPEALVERVNDKWWTTLVRFGPSALRFKEAFQRPRPYQVAWILNHPFTYEAAASAVTPSAMSGHCIQGVIGGCGAYLELRRQLESHVGCVEDLARYAVDFGDRRVFAGVHFPSDNIASWYMALRYCDHLFGSLGQVAKDFMWHAITRYSIVYAALKEAVDADASSPLAGPMDALAREAARPADDFGEGAGRPPAQGAIPPAAQAAGASPIGR